VKACGEVGISSIIRLTYPFSFLLLQLLCYIDAQRALQTLAYC
jgi:hypothetical protein